MQPRWLVVRFCLTLCSLLTPVEAQTIALPQRPISLPADPPLPPPRPSALPPADTLSRPVSLIPVPTGVSAGPPHPAAVPSSSAPEATSPVTGPAPDVVSCTSRLKASNVEVENTPVAPQPDPRCSVVDAVHLAALRLADGSVVTFPDKPTIACATASIFSAFVRDLLAPLAKGTYGSSVETVWTGPGLECRTRDHIPGAKLSAHGQGLAVDIAQLRLRDGHTIEVGRPASEADRAFETAALAGGCGYFHTALGPGSDAFHETHWHLDLIPRGAKGDAKFCE